MTKKNDELKGDNPCNLSADTIPEMIQAGELLLTIPGKPHKSSAWNDGLRMVSLADDPSIATHWLMCKWCNQLWNNGNLNSGTGNYLTHIRNHFKAPVTITASELAVALAEAANFAMTNDFAPSELDFFGCIPVKKKGKKTIPW